MIHPDLIINVFNLLNCKKNVKENNWDIHSRFNNRDVHSIFGVGFIELLKSNPIPELLSVHANIHGRQIYFRRDITSIVFVNKSDGKLGFNENISGTSVKIEGGDKYFFINYDGKHLREDLSLMHSTVSIGRTIDTKKSIEILSNSINLIKKYDFILPHFLNNEAFSNNLLQFIDECNKYDVVYKNTADESKQLDDDMLELRKKAYPIKKRYDELGGDISRIQSIPAWNQDVFLANRSYIDRFTKERVELLQEIDLIKGQIGEKYKILDEKFSSFEQVNESIQKLFNDALKLMCSYLMAYIHIDIYKYIKGIYDTDRFNKLINGKPWFLSNILDNVKEFAFDIEINDTGATSPMTHKFKKWNDMSDKELKYFVFGFGCLYGNDIHSIDRKTIFDLLYKYTQNDNIVWDGRVEIQHTTNVVSTRQVNSLGDASLRDELFVLKRVNEQLVDDLKQYEQKFQVKLDDKLGNFYKSIEQKYSNSIDEIKLELNKQQSLYEKLVNDLSAVMNKVYLHEQLDEIIRNNLQEIEASTASKFDDVQHRYENLIVMNDGLDDKIEGQNQFNKNIQSELLDLAHNVDSLRNVIDQQNTITSSTLRRFGDQLAQQNQPPPPYQ